MSSSDVLGAWVPSFPLDSGASWDDVLTATAALAERDPTSVGVFVAQAARVGALVATLHRRPWTAVLLVPREIDLLASKDLKAAAHLTCVRGATIMGDGDGDAIRRVSEAALARIGRSGEDVNFVLIQSRSGSPVAGAVLRALTNVDVDADVDVATDVDISSGSAERYGVKTFVETRFRGVPQDIHRATYFMESVFPSWCTPVRCVAHRHAMWYDGEVHTLPGLVERIRNRCSHKQFVGWVITFKSFDVHGNALILDRVTNEVARYEPRGYDQGRNYNVAAFDAALSDWCASQLGATYVAPSEYQEAEGPQTIEVREAGNDFSCLPSKGPCAIWSLMFMYMKCSKPTASWRDVAMMLHTHPTATTPLIQAFGHFLQRHKDMTLPECERM